MTDLFGTPEFDLAAQIAEVKRELRKRAQVYPRMVDSGQLKKATADRQTGAMQAVLATLEALEIRDRVMASRVPFPAAGEEAAA